MIKRRPTEDEFAPYYGSYINKTEGEDVLSILTQNNKTTKGFLNSIPDEKWDSAYAQDKCCLLYTSPSPRDRQKSRMPSSA